MMMKLLVALVGVFSSTVCFGWGDLGHQTTAEIAQRFLTTEARQGVRNILGVEPLAYAATFPDVVRSDKRFIDFALYHFTQVPEGKTYETMDPKEHDEKDAMTVITKYPGVLKDPNATREQKIIALRYIIHVVGDVHQPLHVGNGIDMGANLCEVEWTDPLTKVVAKPNPNLHSIWDEYIIEAYRAEKRAGPKHPFFSYDMFATDILETTDYLKSDYEKIKKAKPTEWLDESVELRRTQVYPDEGIAFKVTDSNRPYCGSIKIKKTLTDIPQLSKAYADQKIPIVKERILKGGLRLAALLNDLFGNTEVSIHTDIETLNSLQLKGFND